MNRSVRKFYTLIEIMVVIVIAAILFGIGIPAFTTMIQGSNMTVAIRQFSAKIQAARAYAVTNRCNVAVLLMKTNINAEYCYSAYRVCVVEEEKKADNSYPFREWIEDENWKTLPKGVLRESVSVEETISEIPATDTADIGGSSLTSASALIFQKNGQMTSDTSTIKLRQGRYVDGTGSVYTENVSHPIKIERYSGRVKVEEPVEP